jgi:hypothetical protein
MQSCLIDADLQDTLSVANKMIDRYCEGYDVVYGQRKKRQGDSRLELLTAWVFYRRTVRSVCPEPGLAAPGSYNQPPVEERVEQQKVQRRCDEHQASKRKPSAETRSQRRIRCKHR